MKKLLIMLLAATLLFACGKKENVETDDATVTVEYRNFYLPTFADLFNSLDHLQREDFDKVLDAKYQNDTNDVFLASYYLGYLTADAIISTKSRNKSKLTEIANLMIDFSKLIGVKEDVQKLSDELLNMIQQDKWDELQTSLDKYKNQIEISLYETQQYDLLTLVQVGGWTQGLYRICTLINANYSAEKTEIVDQKGILANIIYNYSKIGNQEIQSRDWYSTIQDNYQKIEDVVKNNTEKTFTKAQIKTLMELANNVNKAMHQ